MCEPLTLLSIGVTVASTAASMASASAQQSQAAKNARNAASTSNAAALKQSAAEYKNQEATMRWQDDTWQQDIQFATQNLGYQEGEFAKQAAYVADAAQAIQKNQAAGMAAVALRSVQQNIATTFQEANLNSKAAVGRAAAQVAADGRGVSGNSVDAIVDDVSRQQGQALSVMEMNRSATAYQARLDMDATKAAGDTQLGQLEASVKTYSPSAPIRAPGPVGATASPTLASPAEQSSLGNTLAIVGAGIQGGLQGFNTANTLTGQTSNQAVKGIGSLLGIG